MKSPSAASAVPLLLSSLLLLNNNGMPVANASSTTMAVGSCEELQEAAAATANGDVVAELTTISISCDGWTTIAVDSNKLKILHPAALVNFSFTNIRFAVGSSGTLRIDNEVEFSQNAEDISTQEVNGGVLNVEAGGYARFLGKVEIANIVVRSQTGGLDFSSDTWSGGAIFNEGYVRFDQHAVISGCESQGGGESGPGDGGAIFNGQNGKIAFRNGVTMIENRSYDDGVGEGGAIFNLGRITVQGEASEFKENVAAIGGAIYNDGDIDFNEDAMVSFIGNRGVEGKGGHVLNKSEVKFEGGALFYGGYAETGGALGLEAGTLTIEGPAMFVSNVGYWFGGGAVFVGENASLVTDNAQVILVGNVGGDDECDDIYYSLNDATNEFTCSSS